MITSATIENFKCFKRLELPELSRITLLGGRNNVGKTAVLEALLLFHTKAQPEIFFNHLALRRIGINSPDPETALAPAFRDYKMEHKIAISISEGPQKETMLVEFNPSIPKSLSVQIPEIDEKNTQVKLAPKSLPPYSVDIIYKSNGAEDQKSHLIVTPSHVERQLEFSDTKQQVVTFSGAKALSNPNDLANLFGRLDVLGKQDIVIEFLQILEPRLKSLSSVALGQVSFIHGDIGIGHKIPIAFMGEGMDRLLFTILAIATNRDSLMLIDEFENGLHYTVMAKVWESISKAALEFNCQIIATTHSYECLQAAFEGTANAGLSDEFRYVRLDRIGEDIIAKTYSHAMMGAAIERGWEVR